MVPYNRVRYDETSHRRDIQQFVIVQTQGLDRDKITEELNARDWPGYYYIVDDNRWWFSDAKAASQFKQTYG